MGKMYYNGNALSHKLREGGRGGIIGRRFGTTKTLFINFNVNKQWDLETLGVKESDYVHEALLGQD